MNSRERYPPGIGNGRGANVGNPNYYARNPQQQYVQRNPMQNQQHNQQQQQQQEQQQWLIRNQMGNDSGASESNKAVQSSSIDTRYNRNPNFLMHFLVCLFFVGIYQGSVTFITLIMLLETILTKFMKHL